MLFFKAFSDHTEIRLGNGDGSTFLQHSDHAVVAFAAILSGGTLNNCCPDIFIVRKSETVWHDACDDTGLFVHSHGTADHIWVFAITVLPDSITNKDDLFGPWLFVCELHPAPQDGLSMEHGKHASAYRRAVITFRGIAVLSDGD